VKVKIIFEPFDDKERAACKLLSITVDRVDGEIAYVGEPERGHRILGAYIDIMKQVIQP
jgi:hypothetical protein